MMPSPQFAQCHTGNQLMSCSVPVLCGLYGGLDDALLAVYHCLQSFRGFPFIVFTDAYNRLNETKHFTSGQKLSAFVNERNFGKCVAGPVQNGMHQSPCCVWIWQSDALQKEAFKKYMDSREAELTKKYGGKND